MFLKRKGSLSPASTYKFIPSNQQEVSYAENRQTCGKISAIDVENGQVGKMKFISSRVQKLPLMEKNSYKTKKYEIQRADEEQYSVQLKNQILQTSLGRSNLSKIKSTDSSSLSPVRTPRFLVSQGRLNNYQDKEIINRYSNYKVQENLLDIKGGAVPEIERSPRKTQIQIGQKNNIIKMNKEEDEEEEEGEESETETKNRKLHRFSLFSQNQNNSNCIKRILESSSRSKQNIKSEVFVGVGNNSHLIKSVANCRWWHNVLDYFDSLQQFSSCEDPTLKDGQIKEEENKYQVLMKVVWTQTRQNQIIFDMPYFKEWKEKDDLDKKDRNLTCIKENKLKVPLDEDKWMVQEISNTLIRNSMIYNHFECNFEISNKKNLFLNLKTYYEKNNQSHLLFQRIPHTFHVKRASSKDSSYAMFLKEYKKREKQNLFVKSNNQNTQTNFKQIKTCKNIWIVKPAENSNRGAGIFVSREVQEIKAYINQKTENENCGGKQTFIIQKYIENPLLYQKRKIDIRCYVLMTNYNGILKAFWYKDGYIRTSSKEFTTKNLKNNFIHLTNDAIQKKQEDYGKFEQGNKLSYFEFQKYILQHTDMNLQFEHNILPQMKVIYNLVLKLKSQRVLIDQSYALDCVRSIYTKIDPNRRQFCFELFGLDYMIDEEQKIWLIEVNSNPCLEISCPLLNRVIPPLIHNVFRIAVDPLTSGTNSDYWSKQSREHFFKQYSLMPNKFECIFNELSDGKAVYNIYADVM